MSVRELFQADMRSGSAYSVGWVGVRKVKPLKKITVSNGKNSDGIHISSCIEVEIGDTDKYGRPNIPPIALSEVATLFLAKALLELVPISMAKADTELQRIIPNVTANTLETPEEPLESDDDAQESFQFVTVPEGWEGVR